MPTSSLITSAPAHRPVPGEPLLARLRPWPAGRAGIEAAAHRYTRARVLAPGLCELLALDGEGTVTPLTDEALAPLGGTLELRARALDNLRARPVERHTEQNGPRGARFHVVSGDCVFTASRVLTVDTLARDLTGRGLGPDGALVAVPDRRRLAFRPLGTDRDPGLLPALDGLADYTAARFTAAADPVSPDVYWWHRGTLARLVRWREPAPARTAAFDLVLRRLGATP
jgi:hypothetical protein